MERTHESAAALVRRASGPISQHLGAFVAALIRQQYVPAVVFVKARHAVAFDRWLAARSVTLPELDEGVVAQFRCRRRRRAGPIRAETARQEQSSVLDVLRYLRQIGACPSAARVSTPTSDRVADYEQYLRCQQGLAASTIERYTGVARQFLAQRFDDGTADLKGLRSVDTIEFVRRQAQRLKPPALKCVTNAVRSFLRYAQYRGDVGPELVDAVPAVATWATTPPLPKAISPEHAQRAIASCDRTSAIGLRDRAVLLILARLGLRAHEIIALQLEDCDWDRGQLTVRGKTGHVAVLPLPVEVGDAIVAYLQRGRPCSEDRHLFLRSMAPIRGLQHGSDGVGSIVRYALARAGVDAPHRGSHQFRHALAVRMLQGGASLPEIGEILRHRSPQSSALYAKVDLEALRRLALPWPGGVR